MSDIERENTVEHACSTLTIKFFNEATAAPSKRRRECVVKEVKGLFGPHLNRVHELFRHPKSLTLNKGLFNCRAL